MPTHLRSFLKSTWKKVVKHLNECENLMKRQVEVEQRDDSGHVHLIQVGTLTRQDPISGPVSDQVQENMECFSVFVSNRMACL